MTMAHGNDAKYILERQHDKCLTFNGAHLNVEWARNQNHTTICPLFTETGVCGDGLCRLSHCKSRLIFCHNYKFKECRLGDKCSFSHDVVKYSRPEQVPAVVPGSRAVSVVSLDEEVAAEEAAVPSVWDAAVNSQQANNKAIRSVEVEVVPSVSTSAGIVTPDAVRPPQPPNPPPSLSRLQLEGGCSGRGRQKRRSDNESVESVYSSSSVERYCKLRRIRHRTREFYCPSEQSEEEWREGGAVFL